MSINERIKRVGFDYGLSQTDLAKICDVTKQSISSIYSGNSKPGLKVIQNILTHCSDLNARWLITGEGSEKQGANNVLNEPKPDYGKCDNCDRLEKQIDYFMQQNTTLLNLLEKNNKELELLRMGESTG